MLANLRKILLGISVRHLVPMLSTAYAQLPIDSERLIHRLSTTCDQCCV